MGNKLNKSTRKKNPVQLTNSQEKTILLIKAMINKMWSVADTLLYSPTEIDYSYQYDGHRLITIAIFYCLCEESYELIVKIIKYSGINVRTHFVNGGSLVTALLNRHNNRRELADNILKILIEYGAIDTDS